jgi:pimeloyl-ACP methyl ester carboxylesterase
MVAQARALLDFDGAQLAADLPCPCLCLAGTEDTLTSIDEVEATAALMPQGVFRAIPGAGHSLLLEAAEVYAELTGFLPAAG